MRTKKLTTCDNSIEADNLMAQLTAAGIECSSYDESVNKAIVGGNIPGIVVLVQEDRYKEALEIANQMQKERKEFLPWCPACGSEDITVEEVSKKSKYYLWAAIILLVLAVWILFTGYSPACGVFAVLSFLSFVYYEKRPNKYKEYTCRKCGKKFKK